MKKRVAYFGTSGRAGHHFLEIVGQFTYEEIKGIEKIDICETIGNGKYQFDFFKWDNYGCLGFPASPDDSRGGCKTVLFVEGATLKSEVLEAVNSSPFVKSQFERLSEKYKKDFPKVEQLKNSEG